MKLLYFILLIISAVFYPMYKDNLSFLLLLTLILLPIVLLILLIISVKFVKIRVSADKTYTEHGKPVKFKVRLTNRSFIPISSATIVLKYKSNNNQFRKFSTSIPISSRSAESVILTVKSEHCGIVDAYIGKIKFNDLIGIFSINKKISFHKEIFIFPVAYPFETSVISNMNTDSDSNLFSHDKAGDDPSEVFDLREYREGDVMNRIHWKLSSRSDNYIIKELSAAVSSQVLFIPDFLGCGNEKQIDDVLDILASFSNFLIKKQLVHHIALLDGNIEFMNISNLDDMYEFLSKQIKLLPFYKIDTSAILELINSEITLQRCYSHIICISSKMNIPIFHELELMNLAERISVICLDENKINTDEIHSKLSETVVFNTTVESFYEDLSFFNI